MAEGPTRAADMFVPIDEDTRTQSPNTGEEKETLVGFLAWQRETLELKCAGLDAEQLARRPIEPSTMSLLGLVRHLAEVERTWFRVRLAGDDRGPIFRTDAEPDGDFDGAVADDAVVTEAWAAWRAECAFADRFIAEAPSLDITGDDPWDGPTSLRVILIHMVEEYARHNGHADLLRQCIDGRVGQ